MTCQDSVVQKPKLKSQSSESLASSDASSPSRLSSLWEEEDFVSASAPCAYCLCLRPCARVLWSGSMASSYSMLYKSRSCCGMSGILRTFSMSILSTFTCVGSGDEEALSRSFKLQLQKTKRPSCVVVSLFLLFVWKRAQVLQFLSQEPELQS